MFALTSPTSVGRSVGIVRLRTKATEFIIFFSGELWKVNGDVMNKQSRTAIFEVGAKVVIEANGQHPTPSFTFMRSLIRISTHKWTAMKTALVSLPQSHRKNAGIVY
jgi:hypothetical protein